MSQYIPQQKTPHLVNDKQNFIYLDKLDQQIDQFSDFIEASSKSTNGVMSNICYFLCCCRCICFRNLKHGKGSCRRFMTSEIYYNSNEIFFGELMQCKLIMEKNFEGKQLFIPAQDGKNQPVIDCMFFPATHGDLIEVDP